jgi:sigma-70-like protein
MRARYAQHAPLLLAYAEGFTGDRSTAEDVVHQTFLRAWRQLPLLLADERPTRVWLIHQIHDVLTTGAGRSHGDTGNNERRDPCTLQNDGYRSTSRAEPGSAHWPWPSG